MKINVEYLEHAIEINDNQVNVLEIENKKLFYKLIKDLFRIEQEGNIDEIIMYDDGIKEISLDKKIKVVVDFFNIDTLSKREITLLEKRITEEMTQTDISKIKQNYLKILEIYRRTISSIDLPLKIEEKPDPNILIKNYDLSIHIKRELLEDLLTFLDIEKELFHHTIIFFVNLKTYLTKEELIEIYKYAIYNKIKIILIDSKSYGVTIEYERKLIIDENLDEFML